MVLQVLLGSKELFRQKFFQVCRGLRYFQELSYEEVAEELELPLGTVKAQLFRARELLAQELKYLEGKM